MPSEETFYFANKHTVIRLMNIVSIVESAFIV